jgi:hypothetical protein
MSQGIPGWLLVITESKIQFRVFDELTYLGINEYTSLGNFSHKNENARPFLSSFSVESSMRPNLIHRDRIYEAWWAMFFTPGVLNLCYYSFHVGNNRILFNLLQCHPNGSYLQITADGPLIFLVVHAAENFPRVFVCSLFVDGIGKRWKLVRFLCATTLVLGCAGKSLQIVTIFLDCTRCSLLPSDPQHFYRH